MLPAYAARLVARRMAGEHPSAVHCFFAEEWGTTKPPFPMPAIAIAPRYYRPGKYDLRCVAGVTVYLDVTDEPRSDDRTPAWLLLGAELAKKASYVEWRAAFPVYAGDVSPRPHFEPLTVLALCFRLATRTWPKWWIQHERKAA